MLAKKLRVYSSSYELIKRHKSRYRHCTSCALHLGRSKVVFARGTVPCDVLLIGEAPGDSEDTLGVPFIGNAGQCLDDMLERADEQSGYPLDLNFACTNICCCVPWLEQAEGTIRPPSPIEAKACKPRLMDFIKIAKPEIIIALGKVPAKYCKEFIGVTIPWYELPHPSWIIRQKEHKQGLEIKRWISNLTRFLRKHF